MALLFLSLSVTQWVEQQARCFVGVNPLLDSYCWFARDVMGAFLVVQNISILWELNPIFMQIL